MGYARIPRKCSGALWVAPAFMEQVEPRFAMGKKASAGWEKEVYAGVIDGKARLNLCS